MSGGARAGRATGDSYRMRIRSAASRPAYPPRLSRSLSLLDYTSYLSIRRPTMGGAASLTASKEAIPRRDSPR